MVSISMPLKLVRYMLSRKNAPNNQIYHDVCCNKNFFKILNNDVTQMSQSLEGQS